MLCVNVLCKIGQYTLPLYILHSAFLESNMLFGFHTERLLVANILFVVIAVALVWVSLYVSRYPKLNFYLFGEKKRS